MNYVVHAIYMTSAKAQFAKLYLICFSTIQRCAILRSPQLFLLLITLLQRFEQKNEMGEGFHQMLDACQTREMYIKKFQNRMCSKKWMFFVPSCSCSCKNEKYMLFMFDCACYVFYFKASIQFKSTSCTVIHMICLDGLAQLKSGAPHHMSPRGKVLLWVENVVGKRYNRVNQCFFISETYKYQWLQYISKVHHYYILQIIISCLCLWVHVCVYVVVVCVCVLNLILSHSKVQEQKR